jgi:hypothetical protein
MSVVSLLGVNVLNNPAKFTDKYEFEITFECLEQLEKGSCFFHANYKNHNANVDQISSGSSPTLDPLLVISMTKNSTPSSSVLSPSE